MNTTYRHTGNGWVSRSGDAGIYRLDLADCWARMQAMTSDPIIRAAGHYEDEISALQAAVAAEWNVLLSTAKALKRRD